MSLHFAQLAPKIWQHPHDASVGDALTFGCGNLWLNISFTIRLPLPTLQFSG